MSLDLSRALHTAVDGGDDEPLDLDLASIGRQIRRRRHVRAGVRAGVGVAAAGAVALALPQVTGGPPTRRPAGLPAPVANAAPGTCGSSIDRLHVADGDGVGLITGSSGFDGGSEFSYQVGQVAGPPGDLGTYVGDTLSALALVKTGSPSEAARLDADRAQAQTELVQAQQALTIVLAEAAATGDDLADQVASARQDVDAAQKRIQDLATLGAADSLAAGQDLQVLITYDRTVVATQQVPVTRDSAGAVATDAGLSSTGVEEHLVACLDTGGDGRRLPAATYEVYLGYARDGGVLTTAAGPWTMTVAHPAAPVGLPRGFPKDFPLVPGRLVAAERDGGGWSVRVATDATDRLAAARQLVSPLVVPTTDDGSGTDALQVRLGDGTTWSVTADDLRDGDGRTEVYYRITPAS